MLSMLCQNVNVILSEQRFCANANMCMSSWVCFLRYPEAHQQTR